MINVNSGQQSAYSVLLQQLGGVPTGRGTLRYRGHPGGNVHTHHILLHWCHGEDQ